jgi:hypothetical protein
MGYPSLIKPPMWALQPALVAPEWGWFWPTFYFLPWWSFYDFGQRALLAKSGTPSLVGSRLGQAMNFDGSGDYFAHPLRANTANLIKEWSLTCYFQTTSTATQNILGVFNTGSVTAWGVALNENVDGKIRVFMRDEGGSQLSVRLTTAESDLTDGEPHIITILGKKSLGASAVTMYYDLHKTGAARALTYAQSGDGSNFADFGFDLTFGARNNRGTVEKEVNGQIYYISVHPKLLPFSQVLALHRDPFGPFRMFDEAGVVFAVAAGGVTLPIFDKHYRSMRAA